MEKLYTKCIFDLLNRRKPSCVENVDPATTRRGRRKVFAVLLLWSRVLGFGRALRLMTYLVCPF